MEDQQEGHDTTRWDTPKMVKLCEPVVHLHQHVCSWYTELDKPKQLPKHSLCLLIGIGYVMVAHLRMHCVQFSRVVLVFRCRNSATPEHFDDRSTVSSRR